MTDYQRVEELKKYLKKSANAISKELGLSSPQIFYDIKAGKCGISKDLAAKIQEKYFNINISWLLTGEGEMLKNTEAPALNINYEHKGVPYYNIDFIGGFDIVLNDQTINPDFYIDFPSYNNADAWANITGHSMEPLIGHGDIIAIKKMNDWQSYILYGEVYGIITDEYRTVKKVRSSKKGDDYLRLVPLNSEYDEQDIPKSIIRNVFKVVGCVKRIF